MRRTVTAVTLSLAVAFVSAGCGSGGSGGRTDTLEVFVERWNDAAAPELRIADVPDPEINEDNPAFDAVYFELAGGLKLGVSVLSGTDKMKLASLTFQKDEVETAAGHAAVRAFMRAFEPGADDETVSRRLADMQEVAGELGDDALVVADGIEYRYADLLGFVLVLGTVADPADG